MRSEYCAKQYRKIVKENLLEQQKQTKLLAKIAKQQSTTIYVSKKMPDISRIANEVESRVFGGLEDGL